MCSRTSVTVLFVMVFVLIGGHAFSDDYRWKQIRDKDGILVFESKTPGSKYKTYKAETIVNVPMVVMFEVLLDVPEFPTWMPGCKKASLLHMIHQDRIEGDFIIHVVWDAIWPFKDRELVVEVATDIDWEKNNRVVVNLSDTNVFQVPLSRGNVRIESFKSQFDFKYIDRNHTHVTYMTMIDPGGNAAPSLAKIQTASIPAKTILALAQKANSQKYFEQARKEYF